MSILISASVLSADMLNLEEEIRKLEKNEIDMLHFDVMDGNFVNNITYGLPILEAVNKSTKMIPDVHLMISDPLVYAERFVKAGADIVSFHLESASDALKTIETIKKSGAKASVAIKPTTPPEDIYGFLPYIDMVLVMTVEPGFGGQSFIPSTIKKVESVHNKIIELGLNVHVQVDGGINDLTVGSVINAGADVIVSGSYLFKAKNMKEAAQKLREVNIC